jgi:hypothetical protein
MFTPIIAAMAGARKVYALTSDSRFGKATDVYEATMQIARKWNIDDRIEILLDRDDDRISKADIITNLGFVRPLDADFLGKLKKTAVVPLMWETWEFREEDIDLENCRSLEIPVLGTNEHHEDLKIFEYIGHTALKLLFETGIEVYSSKIFILGQGEFAEITSKTLKDANATVFYWKTNELIPESKNNAIHFLANADAIIIVDPHSKMQLLGDESKLTAELIASINKGLVILHICGNVDLARFKKIGIHCWPKHIAEPGYMSVTTDYVGPKPLIYLHTAGLKVGERLAEARIGGLNAYESEMKVLNELGVAQGFKGYH